MCQRWAGISLDPCLANAKGAQGGVVSERLGHATVSITLDTYSPAIPAMQEEAATLIAGLVFAEK
jgi:integrase